MFGFCKNKISVDKTGVEQWIIGGNDYDKLIDVGCDDLCFFFASVSTEIPFSDRSFAGTGAGR